ncbi:hypothetical protein [Neobacillus niacini]|uniref:hypothetical protein n=1 Tax=Neobacillus niacini TaxID=86668 RepID=UPI0028658066|nr:hypothetical protein [Neobacillus niacini]MDR7001532.1 hypothetical protein [Neobacillus niacini]
MENTEARLHKTREKLYEIIEEIDRLTELGGANDVELTDIKIKLYEVMEETLDAK